MKTVLVLGAGQSAPYLIHCLLEMADQHDWFVILGDRDVNLARRRVGHHARASAITFDVHDAAMRVAQIQRADVVVNLLPPNYLALVGWECVNQGRHMLSVSYRDQALRDLDLDAQRKSVLLLNELGLDPGIDHMSAMALIRRIHGEGGQITRFCSYGSGIPAPDQPHNPLRYLLTWDPRNVVLAGFRGAQYQEDGRIKIVPYHHVFHHTWMVDVQGVGPLEAYPNRDSMAYLEAFGLKHARTMIRGTLRYPGFCETWSQLVALGLPNETLKIPDLARRTYREVVEMFLPQNLAGSSTEQRVARFLNISPTGHIMETLSWLGLFSDEAVGGGGDTAASMLIGLLHRKLTLQSHQQDMVVLLHELDVEYPGQGRPAERIRSALVARGERGGFTAMSRTVGLPVALATRMLLTGALPLRGSRLPTHPAIYDPILADLKAAGLEFAEEVTPLS